MDIVCETERTWLRKFTPEDLDALGKMHSNPDTMRYLVGGVRRTLEEVQTDLKRYIDHELQFGFSKWAVIGKSSGEFMGRAGLLCFPNSSEIDLGYALLPAYWSKGFAMEIAHSLDEVARKMGLLSRIVATVIAENVASVRVLQKLGYTDCGLGTYWGAPCRVFRPPQAAN